MAVWYDRHGDPAPDVDTMVALGNAFGIRFWAAMQRSNAAHTLSRERHSGLTVELRRPDRRLLLRPAGARDLEDLRHERLRIDRRSHVASLGREHGQLGDLG